MAASASISMEMEEGSSSSPSSGAAGPNSDAEVTVVMARFSLEVSAGCGGRHSTLLDEYERLAFEAQLNRAIVLRRCFSEPSPVRFAHHQRSPADALCGPPGRRHHQGEEPGAPPRYERAAAAGWFWRLHEVVARLLRVFQPVLCWLRSAWERLRRTEEERDAGAARRPPATVPRVQLLDYLR